MEIRGTCGSSSILIRTGAECAMGRTHLPKPIDGRDILDETRFILRARISAEIRPPNLLEFSTMTTEQTLVPAGTTVTAKGDGAAIEVQSTGSRVFLATLSITKIIEQE